jgi:exopolyphosphatase / guanosine-5'-triphosphate,3'-diphosphate pyrophosphatase
VADSGIGSRELAALDLGSNSFHLIIVREEAGQLRIVDRLNEYVRLAAGLDERDRLTEVKMEQAFEALARIGQRLRQIDRRNLRIVGTNTLRKAKNARQFVDRAEVLLHHPVEIISGKEEARLIYLGISRNRRSGSGMNLAIDIGGGSTELIIGGPQGPILMESLFMGCVSSSHRFFPNGVIDRGRMESAIISASIELMPIVENFRSLGWKTAIGSSGSIKSVLKVVREAGWCKNLITAEGLRNLTEKLVQSGSCAPKAFPGLSDRRSPVFPGGVAVLNACFQQLGIEKMEVSDAALREGVIQDLIGRHEHKDIREDSVRDLAARYHVDEAQSQRVEKTALGFLRDVASEWKLENEDYRPLLRWAARLHEVGLDISHHQYHKHGAYIIANTELPGFSLPERAMLATMVRGHRRKLNEPVFQSIPDTILRNVERMVILLRLAVALHRHRSPSDIPEVRLQASQQKLILHLPGDWLEDHPLSVAQFNEENQMISGRGFEVIVSPTCRQDA